MKNSRRYRTDFLFVTPTFLMGVGSVLNIAGNFFLYGNSKSGKEADFRAIESDWGMIGQDLREAANEFKKYLPKKTVND